MILHIPLFTTSLILLTCNENKWISGFSELTQKLTVLKQKYIKLADDRQTLMILHISHVCQTF